MDYKSFKHLNFALIINYSFDKSTILVVVQSIVFSFYWVRVELVIWKHILKIFSRLKNT